MYFTVLATSAHGGGGVVIGDYLNEGLGEVGSAVSRVEVDLLLRSEPRADRQILAPQADLIDPAELGPVDLDKLHELDPDVLARLDLDALFDSMEGYGIGPDHPDWGREHEETRAKGGRLTFRRTAQVVTLTVVSDLSDADLFSEELTVETFARGVREVVDGLAPLASRTKGTDDLDVPALTAHLAARVADLPSDPAALEATLDRVRSAEEARFAAMDPWEQLEIDWTRWAPGVRELLDDPFFWDPADDEAPHGGDLGFDVLEELAEQRRPDPVQLLASLASEMAEDLETLDEEEPEVYAEIVLAVAFAEIKVTGALTAELHRLAAEVVERNVQRRPPETLGLLVRALTSAPRADA